MQLFESCMKCAMLKYTFKGKENKTARAYGLSLRISTKNAHQVCRSINGKTLAKGREILEGLLSETRPLKNKKFYTTTAAEILNVLESAASNAEFKGLEPERLFIQANVGKGFTFRRARRFKLRGEKRKVSNVQIVLEER